ncbi:phospholipase ABHD3-like isoform X1 [Zingiber officinale]|uniref:phospholipase ABHD3-like isoform X1 n=1 Tax=Zingiber officinale TaxID=94328 RepID=UPI001C4D685B|nr:phospholipase ABHD3-like isoform X1 [Zingiber officinale]
MSPESMASDCRTDEVSASELVFRAASMVPAAHYLLACLIVLLVFVYNLLEFHFFRDLLRGFRGDPVVLTFNPNSYIYEGIVAKCRMLRGRYVPTPWLPSPHLQTAFLHFYGRPPNVSYRRQLFCTHDGGTIALDWLLASDVAGDSYYKDKSITQDDTTPIVVVIPGLTSDSDSPYLKHLTYSLAKQGQNIVVSNHRGLAGISITSDCFYNAGWTEDIREVVNYLHQKYPKANLFAVGTSVGANILVKYLGEDEGSTPIVGAVSICSPWDLVVSLTLVCDRFLNRKPIQQFYNRALTIGLKDYAKLHEHVLTRLANWEGIRQSCLVREFDNHATRVVGKFETVDTFYRCCSSVNFIGKVAVPLLCISALDDPLCTREAIPWDECRANVNVVLATTAHGGHLAYFRGLTAQSLWWVEAVREFLNVVQSSPYMHQKKKAPTQGLHLYHEPSIDKGPFINIKEDGNVATSKKYEAQNDHKEELLDSQINQNTKSEDIEIVNIDQRKNVDAEDVQQVVVSSGQELENKNDDKVIHEVAASLNNSVNKLLLKQQMSIWLLVYISVVRTWPILGSALCIVFRKQVRRILSPPWIGNKG